MYERSSDLQPWIDIELEPGAGTDHPALRQLAEKFDLHPVILKELTSPSPRARVENFGSYLFLAIQFPVYDERNFVSRRAEVDFVIRRDAVVTVHYEKLHALDFAAHQRRLGREKGLAGAPGLEITYGLLSHFFAFNQRQLRHISDKVESIGKELFTGTNRELLTRIAYLKRDISEYRVIFNPLGSLLTSLKAEGVRFFGEGSEPYLDDMHGEFLRISQELEDYRSAVLDYEVTNDQLMNAKNGDVMRVLTMMSFVTFPLVLVAALFAVRLDGVPFIDHQHGFWILIGLMFLLATSFFLYFKHKRWL